MPAAGELSIAPGGRANWTLDRDSVERRRGALNRPSGEPAAANTSHLDLLKDIAFVLLINQANDEGELPPGSAKDVSLLMDPFHKHRVLLQPQERVAADERCRELVEQDSTGTVQREASM